LPELPEVETIRRQLAPRVEGRVLRALRIDDARWCAPLEPAEVEAAVTGRRVEALARRGKYLVWHLDGDVHLVMHLRMTGTLLLDPAPGTLYRRVRFELGGTPGELASRGSYTELWFCDPRRFGTGELARTAEELAAFFAARLGVEPLGDEFTAERLRTLARGRRAPVKAFLLDQRHVAGVGNIYADESLFRARIHPLRPAGSLRAPQLAALRDAVVATLNAGIDAGGATIDDFRHADGVMGAFQHEFMVHRRAGEPCPTCGTPVRRFVAAGRTTYACERCQRRPGFKG
jgi:formamidopyrimidine-DNA glycosylase